MLTGGLGLNQAEGANEPRIGSQTGIRERKTKETVRLARCSSFGRNHAHPKNDREERRSERKGHGRSFYRCLNVHRTQSPYFLLNPVAVVPSLNACYAEPGWSLSRDL
jgi:hypothetical protein